MNDLQPKVGPSAGLDIDLSVLVRGGLLLLLLLAFAARLPGLTAQSLWRDEIDALRFSQDSLGTLLGNFSRDRWNGPLYYLVLRPWVAATGQSEFALRYLSLLCSVLGVALLYRLGRDWFGRLPAAVAALLLAASPYAIWYAQEAKMYAMLSPLVLAILYTYRRALEQRTWPLWAGVVVGVWILIGLHSMGVLLVPVLLVLLLAWWPLVRDLFEAPFERLKQAAIGLGLCLLPILIALPWAGRLLLRGGNFGHAFVPLHSMIATMLYAFGRGITTAGGLWPVGLVILFALAGTLLWADPQGLWQRARAALVRRPSNLNLAEIAQPAYVAALWAWLLVPILGLLIISTRVPMFVDRYLIWIGPALFLLIARGYDELRKRMALLATLCLVALLAFNAWSVLMQTTTPIKSDFRGAAAYVRAMRSPEEPILFHISYVRDTFEYYFGPVLSAADGVPTNEATTPEQVDQAMRAQLERFQPQGGSPLGDGPGSLPPTVWLVLSEPEMWDPRGMTVAWLDAHASPDLRADFARVSVIRYRFDAP